MITLRERRIRTSMTALLFLFLLTVSPISSGQEPATADWSNLVKGLKDKDARVRAEAVLRLTALGDAAEPAIPALVEALSDSDAKVRYRSLIALGNLWSGLESGPEIEAAVPAIIKLLKDKDYYTRRRAIEALHRIGPSARPALPALKKIMNDRNDPLWVSAFGAVRDIERPPTDDVATLAELLKDKDATVRSQAAERLSSMAMREVLLYGGFKGEVAIPALIEALKDPESKVRLYSLSTLTDFMYHAEPPDFGVIIPTVTELLNDKDKNIRWQAALMLGKIGPRSRPAIPLLTQILSDDEEGVRSYAAFALGQIGPESAVAAPSLIKLLKDPFANVRESAATALAKIDPSSARLVVAALSEDLKHEKPDFSGRAARALGSFGPEAKSATPLLVEILKNENTTWRHAAVRTLEKIGPGAHEAVPALRTVLNDQVEYIRVAAAVALLKVAPESETEIAPALLKQARAKIEEDEATARAGGHIRYGLYRTKPGTEWDEAMDLVSRGVQFDTKGNLEAAVASFTEALKIDPQYANAYHRRGDIHRRTGKYDAAIADFTRAIESDQRSTEIHYLARGATYIDSRDYDAAIADFTEIIKLNSYNADAYYARGLANQLKTNLEAAIADYDRAINMNPPAPKAFGARGSIKLTQGKVAEALTDFEKAVKVDPQNASNYEGLGDAYARMGDTGKARDNLGKALSLSTDAESKARIKKKLNDSAKQQ